MRMMKLKRALAGALAVLLAINFTLVTPAQARMVTTDQVIHQADLASDRARVESFLLRGDVRDQLAVLGIDPQEAASRVASLSDQEIQQIAGQLDELPAGEGAVGAIIGAAVLIFIILLVTDLLGLTDVFPFVKKQN